MSTVRQCVVAAVLIAFVWVVHWVTHIPVDQSFHNVELTVLVVIADRLH